MPAIDKPGDPGAAERGHRPVVLPDGEVQGSGAGAGGGGTPEDFDWDPASGAERDLEPRRRVERRIERGAAHRPPPCASSAR